MAEIIKNRYEFIFLFECINGNPNGDPDAGNAPRIDPQDMHGLVSDVAVKRRIRNFVQLEKENKMPYSIFIEQSTNLNKNISRAYEENGGIPEKATHDKAMAARKWLCNNFYDIRAFGAVLSTGANAGQVRGPVQLSFSRSLDQIVPLDISITRVAVTENIKGDSSSKAYEEWEKSQAIDKLHTMGRKSLIPYGLYVGKGFISANLAEDTGFSEDDLELLWKAILNMYDQDRSASKGEMSTIQPLIIFKHVGTDSNKEQRIKQGMMGCAPAHKLFDLVEVQKKNGVEVPRSYKDYKLTVKANALPTGVKLGLAYTLGDGTTKIAWDNWETLQKDLPWITIE